MEFFQENYVWFIVGGIIILMAIIGYIADKNDFYREEVHKYTKPIKEKKDKKEKKEKEEKEEKKEEKIKIEAKGIGDISQEITDNIKSEDQIVNIDENSNQELDESLFVPLTDTLPPVENETSLESNTAEVNDLPPVAEEEDIWKF